LFSEREKPLFKARRKKGSGAKRCIFFLLASPLRDHEERSDE